MEPLRAVASAELLSTVVEKLTLGSEPISCVYPSCQSSAPVELFNVHLSRCRRNWRGPMSVCSYNGAHVVPCPEECYHSLTCPDRWLNAHASECKEMLLEETKFTIHSESDGAKKQGSETSGVMKKRTQAAYFLRGERYGKCRNVGPRLQSFYSRQSGMKPSVSPPAVGRSQRSLKWRGSSMSSMRGGRGRTRVLPISGRQNSGSEAFSVDSAFADDLPTSAGRGFSPWASSKPHSSALFDTIRRNSMAQKRWPAANVSDRQQ